MQHWAGMYLYPNVWIQFCWTRPKLSVAARQTPNRMWKLPKFCPMCLNHHIFCKQWAKSPFQKKKQNSPSHLRTGKASPRDSGTSVRIRGTLLITHMKINLKLYKNDFLNLGPNLLAEGTGDKVTSNLLF